MNYYNEIFFLLFAIMFVMLVISAGPHYRNGTNKNSAKLLLMIPLGGAFSYILFLIAPHVHRGLITVANLMLMASVLGQGILMCHWQGQSIKKLFRMTLAVLLLAGVVFEYLRLHGDFQQRVSLVLVWLLVASLWCCLEAYRLHQKRMSFYLRAFIASMVISGGINLLRLWLIWMDPPSNINLYEEPLLVLLLRFMGVAFHLLIIVFMLSHASERAHWHHLAILQAKDKTEALNAELIRLIGERDQMLMINSRFSTVSSLAMFNSAIVHELSQPLAALTVTLQEARWHMNDTNPAGQAAMDQGLAVVQKIDKMNQNLRNLMMAQKPEHEPLDLWLCIEDILPILQNEARRRGVAISVQTSPGAGHVVANKVLFERIILNLVANAMDALTSATSKSDQPRIALVLKRQLREGQAHALVTVQDNGPGFASHLLSQEWMHFQSSKDSGMGVGLILCKYILGTWSGTLSLANLPEGGASVQLSIPLQGS